MSCDYRCHIEIPDRLCLECCDGPDLHLVGIQLRGELLARYQAMKHNLEIEAQRIEDLIDRLDSYIGSL